MKKWCLVDDCIEKRGLETLYVFNSKEEALNEAEKMWNRLCKSDKSDRTSFQVCVCNVEIYENGQWDYAENDYDRYECEADFVSK